MSFKIIDTQFQANNGPLDRRDVYERDGVEAAFTLAGKLAAHTNGGVIVIDEHNCVWFEHRIRGNSVEHATKEQRQLYAISA